MYIQLLFLCTSTSLGISHAVLAILRNVFNHKLSSSTDFYSASFDGSSHKLLSLCTGPQVDCTLEAAALALNNVTEFWKTYHLHTSEIIRILNFAIL